RRSWFFESKGRIKVKGKADEVEVFEVAGPRPHAAEGDERPAFSGRSLELDALKQERNMADDGESRVVAVIGRAGLGKSRLVREFLAGEKGRIIRARCLSYQQESPFGILAQILETGLDWRMDDEASNVDRCRSAGLADPALGAAAV